MSDPFARAQRVIRSAYARPIAYTGAGLVATALTAIRSDPQADPFMGAGSSVTRVAFELDAADFPGATPGAGDLIVEDPDGAALRWRVIDAPRDRATKTYSANVEATT